MGPLPVFCAKLDSHKIRVGGGLPPSPKVCKTNFAQDGIIGSIFGLIDIEREKDRGKVLTPEIDREIDQERFLILEKIAK